MVSDPIVHHFGKPYMKEYSLGAGEWLLTHSHTQDHVSVLLEGDAILMIGDEATELRGPCSVIVKAHLNHSVRAVTPIHWFCIWDMDCSDVDAHEKLVIEDQSMTVESAFEKMGKSCLP